MYEPTGYHWRVAGLPFSILFALLFSITILIWRVGFFHEPFSEFQPEKKEISEPTSGKKKTAVFPAPKPLFEYIEVTGGCGPHFEGECLNARSGPGAEYPSVMKLRNGIVLKVGEKVERNGHAWYKIVFDEKIRYPERITTDWYISADYVRPLLDEGTREKKDPEKNASGQRIIIDRSEQMLYAYDRNGLFMKTAISTGLEATPTPRGLFSVFRKTPSRYMQGPIPDVSDQFYDLPGVPWNLYFTYQGAAIHGTYWHENFGKQSSHGCVNLMPTEAQKLYNWAGVGTFVIVQE